MEKTTRKVKVEREVVEKEVTVVTVSQDEIKKAMGEATVKVAKVLEDPVFILSGALVTAELIDYLFYNDEGEKED